MHILILWLGFAGAWLLVAGPLYQAALELQEQEIEHERIHELQKSIPQPQPVSLYWWLLPPIKLYLEQLRSRRYRTLFIVLLPKKPTS